MTYTKAPGTVGERIFWARKRKGLSQVRLAAQIGTSQRHIVRLEKNENKPKEPMRIALAGALDQKPEFFESDDDEESDLPLADLLNALISRIHKDAIATVRAEINKELEEVA